MPPKESINSYIAKEIVGFSIIDVGMDFSDVR